MDQDHEHDLAIHFLEKFLDAFDTSKPISELGTRIAILEHLATEVVEFFAKIEAARYD